MTGQMVYQAQEDLARMEKGTEFHAAQAKLVASAQAQVGGPVFRIPEANVAYLREQITNKVNKRAAKLSLPPVEIIDLEQEVIERKRTNEFGEQVTEKNLWQYVAIKGETPKVAGYSFIATLQHEEAGNIVRTIPVLRLDGQEIELPDLTSYRDVDPVCDHCGKRRNRKDTYLVWNQETGEIQQVGSNCLGDFLGAADPQRYASFCEYLRDFFDDLGGGEYYGPRIETAFEMREFLASTSRMIRAYGWHSASSYDDEPTSGRAWYNLENYGKTDKYTGQPLWLDIEDSDWDLADRTLEWVENELLPRDDKNDYQHNLSIALQAKGVTYRTKGLVASAVRAYDRERENKLRFEKQQEKNQVKGWVGEIGERSEYDVTLMKTVPVENHYAGPYDDHTKPLYVFEDAEGNEIKWFASKWLDDTFKDGESYKISVKVKSHDDHAKFGKSTRVTHVKVVK